MFAMMRTVPPSTNHSGAQVWATPGTPAFNPLVTRNFAQVNHELGADPAAHAKIQLLSVSFDPDHDTPERLRAYGATYIGSDTANAFAHWDFAVPDKTVLPEMVKFFDVGITTGPDESITHTLSTTLVGPDGKVVRFYPGNEWTAQQVTADVERWLQVKAERVYIFGDNSAIFKLI